MLKINRIILLFILSSLLIAQGKMNAIGIGHFYQYQGINNAADGITELTPSFQEKVSFSNPATWHNLKFAYLSLSYGGNQNSLEERSVTNGYSSLSNAIFLIPIKSKSSFGFSLSPYIDQRVNMIEEDSTLFFETNDSSYAFTRAFNRSGGILSFKIGSSYKINEKISLGVLYNVLSGSSRQSESIYFGGSSIVQSSRARYNGIISDIFLSAELFNDFNFYMKITNTIKALEVAFEQGHLFDDVNGNGYHDYNPPYYDFPYPDSVSTNPEKRYKNIHSPQGYKFSIQKIIRKRTSLAFEYDIMNDNSKIDDVEFILPISNWIKQTQSFKTSLVHYPGMYSLSLLDKFSLKAGLAYRTHMLNSSNIEITEMGYSIGIGFRFKPVGNQVDINYYFGNREYSDFSDKELIQQLQVGISLADIWFVKRRQK